MVLHKKNTNLLQIANITKSHFPALPADYRKSNPVVNDVSELHICITIRLPTIVLEAVGANEISRKNVIKQFADLQKKVFTFYFVR